MRPSAKSWLITAMKTSTPVAVSSPKASPIPSPSTKLWAESPRAPSAPTWWWARACSGSSRWWSTSTRSTRKKARKPAPTSSADLARVADALECLGQHVEQSDRDDDAAGQRHQGRQRVREAQAERAAGEGRGDGGEREGEGRSIPSRENDNHSHQRCKLRRDGTAARSEWAGACPRRARRGRARGRAAARRAVVELLAGQDCCLSAQEIAERLRSGGDRVGTASVYRALDLLHREGLVQRVEVGQGGARYERAHPGGDHHHHVVCERCGRITPFEDRSSSERSSGSRALRHSVSGHDVADPRRLPAECAGDLRLPERRPSAGHTEPCCPSPTPATGSSMSSYAVPVIMRAIGSMPAPVIRERTDQVSRAAASAHALTRGRAA